MVGPNGQLGTRPPTDIALLIPIHHVDARSVHQLRTGRKRFYTAPPRKPIKRLVNKVFRVVIERPPHRQIIFEQGSVVGFAHIKFNRFFSGDFDDLGGDFQGQPLATVQVAIAVDGLPVKIDFIVDKHRDAPSVVPGVADGRKRQAADVVAIVFEVGRHDVRFIPHRRRSIGHVGVVAKNHLARGRAVTTQHPGVGTQPLRHGARGIQGMHPRSQP